MEMKTTITALLVLIAPRGEEKDELKKACEKTASASSYFYQWELQTLVKGRAGKQAGAGEFVAPDLLTARTGVLDLVKKGDRAMARGPMGWVKPEEDPKLQEAADHLKPPHELVAYVVESLLTPKRDKDAEVRKAKCRVVRGSLDGDGLKGLLRAGGGNLDQLEKVLDWKASKTSVQLFVEIQGGHLVKMSVESELVISPDVAKGQPPVVMTRVVEFMELGEAKPSIAPEVKAALGIEEK
jgi:hypothetical protein